MNKQISPITFLAWLLILAGLSGTIYFFCFFDTSLPAPQISEDVLGIDRIQNIGLISDRQNGIIISLVALIIGVALAIVSMVLNSKKTPPTQSSSDKPINYWQTNSELEKRQPVSEKHLQTILEKLKEKEKK